MSCEAKHIARTEPYFPYGEGVQFVLTMQGANFTVFATNERPRSSVN